MFASPFSVTSSHSSEHEPVARDSSIIVAVDRDKNSQQAAKWAVDKLLTRGSMLQLVHVRGRRLFRRFIYKYANVGFLHQQFNMYDMRIKVDYSPCYTKQPQQPLS
jgi:hypothetical protein